MTSPPAMGQQTVSAPPGGATILDLSVPVPGRFNLVDHAITRMDRGLVGALVVEGPADPAVFQAGTDSGPKLAPVRPLTPASLRQVTIRAGARTKAPGPVRPGKAPGRFRRTTPAAPASSQRRP